MAGGQPADMKAPFIMSGVSHFIISPPSICTSREIDISERLHDLSISVKKKDKNGEYLVV